MIGEITAIVQSQNKKIGLYGNFGANLVFAMAFLYNKEDGSITVCGGVYEEKDRNWNTEF